MSSTGRSLRRSQRRNMSCSGGSPGNSPGGGDRREGRQLLRPTAQGATRVPGSDRRRDHGGRVAGTYASTRAGRGGDSILAGGRLSRWGHVEMTNSSRTRQPEAPQQRVPDAKAATDVVTEPEAVVTEPAAAAESAMPGTSGDGRVELPVLVPEVIRVPILSVRVAHVAVPHVSLPRPSGPLPVVGRTGRRRRVGGARLAGGSGGGDRQLRGRAAGDADEQGTGRRGCGRRRPVPGRDTDRRLTSRRCPAKASTWQGRIGPFGADDLGCGATSGGFLRSESRCQEVCVGGARARVSARARVVRPLVRRLATVAGAAEPRQGMTIGEAADRYQVDRSTIMRIRTVAKDWALAASRPG